MNASFQKQTFNIPKGFVVILAMLSSITPLAVDMYLPSFMQMSAYFYTSIDQIEVTVAIFLLGFGLGQLIGGPLSDRYGRKIFISLGLVIYILFSFFITTSQTVEELWIFRFFQAVGGGFAVVNTNAIVRDVYHGKEGAKIFSIISMIIMVAPMAAPVIGTLIINFFDWHYIFYFLCLYAFLLSYFIVKLPETSPKIEDKNLYKNYKRILTSRKSLALIAANAFGFSGLFVFITKSSFIYMEYFKSGPNLFTLLLGMNVLSLLICSRLNIKFLQNHTPFSILMKGMTVQVLAGAALFLSSPYHTMESVLILMMVYIGTLGFVFANSISLLLEDFGDISATANALNGVIGFIVAAFIGFVSSLIHDGSLASIFALMASTSAVAFLILYFLLRKHYLS